MVVYAISVVLMGIVFFEEALSLVKIAGIVLGLIAIVFMNL